MTNTDAKNQITSKELSIFFFFTRNLSKEKPRSDLVCNFWGKTDLGKFSRTKSNFVTTITEKLIHKFELLAQREALLVKPTNKMKRNERRKTI